MKRKQELRPGDGVDVRVFKWNGSFADGHVNDREAWIPGTVHHVDDSTVTILIHEGIKYRVYPFESSDWRPA
jgi:hypothetical protein